MRHQAGQTQQGKKLTEAIENLEKTLFPAFRAALWETGTNPEKLEALVPQVTAAARSVLPLLKITFEDARMQERAKHYLTRFRNFEKLVTALTMPSSWADLVTIFKDNSTRSKNVREKFREYAKEIMGFVDWFDTEHQDTLVVGGWRVALLSSASTDWSRDLVEALQHTLQETTRYLKSGGFGAFAGGIVHAFPSKSVPGSPSGVLASYRHTTDKMELAAGSDPSRAAQSMVHETGHRVYFKGLSANSRHEWDSFFNAESGTPDVDTLIKMWESYVVNTGVESDRYHRHTPAFMSFLKQSDPDKAMWLEIISDKLPELRAFDALSGSPKKGAKTGLDVLIENKATIKVFLHPVTAYSATNAKELYAETFMAYLTEGPQRVPEVVRVMFRRATPMLKTAQEANMTHTYDRRTASYADDETEARIQLHQWLGELEKLVESARTDVKKPDGPHMGSGHAPVADLVSFLNGIKHESWHDFYFR